VSSRRAHRPGHGATREEIANAVSFLTSDDATSCTARFCPADGGRVAACASPIHLSTAKDDITMILITTAGKVGAEAARLLAAEGKPVRVIARNPEKVAALSQAGVDVVEGDLEVPSSIDAALRGVSSVILVSLAIPNQELNVVISAVRADVDHVVKITSKASRDSPIARRRGQTEIEEGLIASGLGYTLLRNNVYMQNFLMLAPAIAKTSSFGANTGDGSAGLIDSRDVAAVAAQIATNPAPHKDKTYWLTGPEALTYAEAAAVFSHVLNRPIDFHRLSDEEQTQAMIAAGVPEPVAQMNTQALALLAQGDSDWVTDDVSTILGRPPRSFEQFCTDHAEAFSATREDRQ
jgi:uncharacterized protein YbjT (DUF2867 family)